MYLLMGLASVMLGLLVQDRQPICGFTRNTTFNVRLIRKASVRIPASGMKLAVEVYLRKANGAACGCRQQDIPPSIHPHAPLLFATRNDGLHSVVSGRIRPLTTSRDPSYLADNRKGARIPTDTGPFRP